VIREIIGRPFYHAQSIKSIIGKGVHVKTDELVVQTASQAITASIPQEKRNGEEVATFTTLPCISLWITAVTLPLMLQSKSHRSEREGQLQEGKY
jgi:hypothetical protein